MPGWEPCQVEWWEDIAASLRRAGAWTDSAIRMDLRVLFSRRGTEAWPPARGELAVRWGLESSGKRFRRYLEIAGDPSSWQDESTKKEMPGPLVINRARSRASANPAPTDPPTERQPTRQPIEVVGPAESPPTANPPANPAPTDPPTRRQPKPSRVIARDLPPSPGSTLTENTHSAGAEGACAEASGSIPAWVPPADSCKPHTRLDVLSMVARVAEAVLGRPFIPKCGKTVGKEVLALWTSLGKPAPGDLASQMELIAEAAKNCPYPLFANDVRWEGRSDGVDRSRSVATLCVQRRFDERLAEARRWAEAGKPTGRNGTRVVPQTDPCPWREGMPIWFRPDHRDDERDKSEKLDGRRDWCRKQAQPELPVEAT